MQQQHVNASSSLGTDCDSIVGCYADGYEFGKRAGEYDVSNGNDHSSKCSPNDSLSWCTGYKLGYEAGYLSAKTLGRVLVASLLLVNLCYLGAL